MQGILKSNHQKLCNCLQEVKAISPATENVLTELEEELLSVFKIYQQKMADLKKLILMYEEKEKLIRNEVKRIRKRSIIVAKKAKSNVLSKVVILSIALLHSSFISIEAPKFFMIF